MKLIEDVASGKNEPLNESETLDLEEVSEGKRLSSLECNWMGELIQLMTHLKDNQ